MVDRSRRAVLAGLGGAGLAGLGAFGSRRVPDARGESDAVVGTVTDLAGDPVADASVEAVRAAGTDLDSTRTDSDGRFSLAAEGPIWVRAAPTDRSTGVRAVDPASQATIRTPPADATTLRFAGDTMFARRFYEADDDALRPYFEIDPDDRLTDHRHILEHTAPLFEAADIASVNLETPLSTTDWRHPEKTYTYASHPVAAAALADAGIDYAALGNNHAFDALEPGLEETVAALDDADIAHSGAGFSSDGAWEPAVLERETSHVSNASDGTAIAFVSCTTYVGAGYDIDWSADRNSDERHRIEDDGETLAFDGSVGVAEADDERLADAVERASDAADIVVTQIHGGEEYQREPTDELRELAKTAAAAGSDLVVNHHPHVVGGLEVVEGALVAWSLGNFVFDQEFWETLQSYVLTVDVTADGVLAARIEPLLLEGYVPKGVTGQPNRSIRWATAGRSGDRFSLNAGGLEYVAAETPDPRSETVSISGSDAIYARREGWLESVESGDEGAEGGEDETDGNTVRVGRNRLLTGDFGDTVVDEQRYEGPLWRFGRDGDSSGSGIGVDDGDGGDGGVRLTRAVDDVDRALLSPRHRLPISDDSSAFTLIGRYRFDRTGESDGSTDDGDGDDADGDSDDPPLEIRCSWYDDTVGGSFEHRSLRPDATDGDWERLRVDLEPPTDATHVDLFAWLSPPADGGDGRSDDEGSEPTREVAFDELRLLEWTADPTGGREYDHLEIDGNATLTVATEGGENGRRWTDLDGNRLGFESE